MSAINWNELPLAWSVQQGFDVSLPDSDGFLMAAVVLCEKEKYVHIAVSGLAIYSIFFLFSIAEYQCFQSSEMWHLYKICDCCISEELGTLSAWHTVDSAT